MIYEKLLKIQTELKAPKNQRNTFGNYNYRNAEDILEAVKPIQAKYAAVTLLSDKIIVIGERYYVEATAKLVDIENGEYIEVTASAREEENKKGMDGSQVTGASSSYARKYALNGLFAIDDTKDSDATNDGKEEQKKEKTQKSDNADVPFPEVKPTGREKIISTILGGKTEYIERLRVKMAEMYARTDFEKLNDLQFKQITDLANEFADKKGL